MHYDADGFPQILIIQSGFPRRNTCTIGGGARYAGYCWSSRVCWSI